MLCRYSIPRSAFLAALLLWGCGTEGEDVVFQFNPASVRNGKAGVTVLTGRDGQGRPTVRYLGEIRNDSEQPLCRVNVVFTTLDGGANPVDEDPAAVVAEVNGETLVIPTSPQNPQDLRAVNHCLKPGSVGSFDTKSQPLTADFAEFAFEVCARTNGSPDPCEVPEPFEEQSVALEIVSLDVTQDPDDNRLFRGKVRNTEDQAVRPEALAHDIRVHATILGGEGDLKGKVIGTAISGILRAQNCPDEVNATPLSCLGPGVIADFPVETDVPVSETCEASGECFQLRIYHLEP